MLVAANLAVPAIASAQASDFWIESNLPIGSDNGHALLSLDTVEALSLAHKAFKTLRRDTSAYSAVRISVDDQFLKISFLPRDIGLDDDNIVRVILRNPTLEFVSIEWRAGGVKGDTSR